MKKTIQISLMFFANLAFADTWIEHSFDESPLECPFLLILEDGDYEILNDCYGMDPMHPVVERGSYNLLAGNIEFYRQDQDDLFFNTRSNTVRMAYSEEKDILVLENELITIEMKIFEGHVAKKYWQSIEKGGSALTVFRSPTRLIS